MITTYRKLTAGQAFALAKQAEAAGSEYELGEAGDGIFIKITDRYTCAK